MPCSRMPARIVVSISSRVRWSMTTESMPAASSRCDSRSPAGPAPTIATRVRTVVVGACRLLRRGLDHCRERPRQAAGPIPVQRDAALNQRGAVQPRIPERPLDLAGRAVQLHQRRLDRRVARQHDRQRRDDGAGLVPHRDADARRDLLDVARRDRMAEPANLGQLAAQGGGIRDRLRRDAGEPAGEDPLLQVALAEREQDESGRRGVQRQPPRDARHVRARLRSAQPFQEQRLVLLQDRELRVLADARLHPLHRRHRELAQAQRVGRAGGELPQPQPDPHATVVVALEQPGVDEVADDPMRRRGRQAGAAADLGGGLDGARRREGLEHAHDPIGHRVAGRGVRHTTRMAH